MAVKYEVNGQGLVVKLTTLDDKEYQVIQKKLAGKPERIRSRWSRWYNLKKMVLGQEPGVWYAYEPFKDEDELKMARNTLARFRTDAQLKKGLGGKVIEAYMSREELCLNVCVREP